MDFWKTGDYLKYATAIREASRRTGVPEKLLTLTLWQASNFDPEHIKGQCRNPIGVIGIANLTREQAYQLWGQGKDLRHDPAASIIGAAHILSLHQMRFNDWILATLAYHTSAKIVQEHLREHKAMPIEATRYAMQVSAQMSLW